MSKMNFNTEADLCQHVIDAIRPRGWEVYPEWNGWDFLAVYREGEKIWTVGVQAKRKWTTSLLRQCAISKLDGRAHWTVALVDKHTRAGMNEYMPVLRAMGVIPVIIGNPDRGFESITLREDRYGYNRWELSNFKKVGDGNKRLRSYSKSYRRLSLVPFLNNNPKFDLPDFEPVAPAGVPCAGGVPTHYTLSVRKMVETYMESGETFTIKEANKIFDYSYTFCNSIVNQLADKTGERRDRSCLYALKPDVLDIAKKMAPTGWVEKYDREEIQPS